MAFERGQKVEILSQEEGFKGSLFPAVIISKVSDNNFIVQYSTLHKGQHDDEFRPLIQDEGQHDDDEFRPLREFCKENEIRPIPPNIYVSKFRVKDKVDAYYIDGWWVGEIVKCIDKKYLVCFKRFEEERLFEFEDLRVHQDWSKGGQWSIPRKVGRPLGSKGKLVLVNDHQKLGKPIKLETKLLMGP